MTAILKTAIFHLDSSQRNNGDISTPQWQIPIFNQSNSNSKLRVKIMSAIVPYCFNQLQTTTVTYSITHNMTPSNGSFIVTAGNYNAISILREIKTKLIASILALTGVTITTFDFQYDKNNYFITFAFSSELATVTITLDYTSALMKMMGFTSSITFTDSTSQTSSKPVDCNPARAIYLRSDTLKVNSFEAITTNMTSSDIVSKMLIYVNPGGYIRHASDYINLFNTSIDSIVFKLTDSQSATALQLSLDWSIVITLEEYINKDVIKADKDEHEANINIMDLEKQREGNIKELELYKKNLLEKAKNKIIST